MSARSPFILIASLCFIAYVSSVSYKESVEKCKTKYGIDDAPLDLFLASGNFPPGKENLKCFFECLSDNLGIINGKEFDVQKIKTVREENKNESELVFFSDPALQACSDKLGAETVCDGVYQFVKCALEFNQKLQAAGH